MLKSTPFYLVSILLFLLPNLALSEGFVCNPNNTSSATASCGDRNGLVVYAEFDYEQSGTHNYSCYYMGGANKDTPYKFKSVTCGGTCPSELFFNQDSGSCDDEPPEPPIDCNDNDTVHLEDFYFENLTLDSRPDKLDYCSGPGGKGGCDMKEAGVSGCTSSTYAKGISCTGEFKSSGRCPEGTQTEADPTTSVPEGEKLAIVTPELDGTQVETDKFKFDSGKQGNCGTVNGETKCFPLAESNQSGSNKGKDLLVKEKGDTEGTEGLEKIGEIKDDKGKEYNVYNSTVNNSTAIVGGFDNKGDSGTGDGSGTGTGSEDGTNSGSGDGTGSGDGDGATSEVETWGDNPEGVDGEALQGEIDGYVSELNQASNDLATENEEKAQQVAGDMQGALVDYLMPNIQYSGGCDLGTVNINLFGANGSAPLSFCPYVQIFETMGNIFFLFANISAVFIFIRVFTGTGG